MKKMAAMDDIKIVKDAHEQFKIMIDKMTSIDDKRSFSRVFDRVKIDDTGCVYVFKDFVPAKDLRVCLATHTLDSEAFFIHTETVSYIVFRTPMVSLNKDNGVEYIRKFVSDKRRIDHLRGTFVHEYTHYIDYNDFMGDSAEFAKEFLDDRLNDQMKVGNYSWYYRVPTEFHAHYNEGLSRLVRLLLGSVERAVERGIDCDEIDKQLTEDFPIDSELTEEKLLTIINRFWDRSFIKELGKDSKWNKKIKSKCYILYVTAVEIAHKAIKEYKNGTPRPRKRIFRKI